MIEALTHAGVGFLVALWLGVMLGVLIAWDKRVLLLLIFGVGTFIVLTTLEAGPERTAAEMNWSLMFGAIPGYLVGFPTGKAVYRQVVEE